LARLERLQRRSRSQLSRCASCSRYRSLGRRARTRALAGATAWATRSLPLPHVSAGHAALFGFESEKFGRKAMRHARFAFGLAFALVAPAVMAQTAAPPAPSAQPGSNSARAGKPADLCAEVLAFVHPPAPAGGGAPAAGQSQAAAQPPANAATAVTAPAQKEGVPQPSPGGGAPQQSSSLSGPVTPSGPGASGPQGAAQPGQGGPPPASGDAAKAPAPRPAPQQAAAPAPAAPAAPPAPKPTAAQIEKVETAARDHNLQGCRDVAQEMRRAGIVMPPPLLALAALDPKFFDTDQKQQ
jgi:hypothetical protein